MPLSTYFVCTTRNDYRDTGSAGLRGDELNRQAVRIRWLRVLHLVQVRGRLNRYSADLYFGPGPLPAESVPYSALLYPLPPPWSFIIGPACRRRSSRFTRPSTTDRSFRQSRDASFLLPPSSGASCSRCRRLLSMKLLSCPLWRSPKERFATARHRQYVPLFAPGRGFTRTKRHRDDESMQDQQGPTCTQVCAFH